jgi:hypothetical protein
MALPLAPLAELRTPSAYVTASRTDPESTWNAYPAQPVEVQAALTGESSSLIANDPKPGPVVEPAAVLVLLPGNARLSSTLSEFARENGWEIAWEIDRDFPIDYAARFEGPFLEIIGSVVASLRATDAPIRAKVYRANKVVRIIHATR